jgi:protein-S-isoprenylcysteine O-methyltransferase Ste14
VTLVDRYLIVRAGSLYLAVMLTAIVWVWRRPKPPAVAAALLASIWNLPMLLAFNVAAIHFGWWRFDGRGGIFLGMPVDLYLSWVWIWGGVFALAFPSRHLGIVLIVALAADLLLMPLATPVLQLGSWWVAGEFVGISVGLLPGLLLARWTLGDEHLRERALLQMLAFSGLLGFVLPAIAIEGSGGGWFNPLTLPAWQLCLIAQALAVPVLLGLTAVQEFETRGGGTPVPFDPPRTLVASGVYAYVRNPMQLSAVVFLLMLAAVLRNPWIGAAGVMAHVYSAGLAGWDEDEDLRRRFGAAWIAYRGAVRCWLPHVRPRHVPGRPPARLFVSESCGMCRQVGEWFAQRGARQLIIVPAETHPSGALTRITYDPGDGAREASGVEAVARALEHVHLGWAFLGFALRLPVMCQLAQLLVDASGGEPRETPVVMSRSAPE